MKIPRKLKKKLKARFLRFNSLVRVWRTKELCIKRITPDYRWAWAQTNFGSLSHPRGFYLVVDPGGFF